MGLDCAAFLAARKPPMVVCFASFGWNGLMVSKLFTLLAQGCPVLFFAAATWVKVPQLLLREPWCL